MPTAHFSVGEHRIELITDLGGKETITYDGEVVSQKRNHIQLLSLHSFEVEENGKIVKYEMRLQNKLSGIIKYSLKRDRKIVKRDSLPSLTRFILRLLLCLIGFALLFNVLVLFILINAAGVTITDRPILFLTIAFSVACGLIYLAFGLFLKKLLPKNIGFITTVLWIQIGISSANLLFNLMSQTLAGNIVASLPSALVKSCSIWLFWSMLENCKVVAKELKLKSR